MNPIKALPILGTNILNHQTVIKKLDPFYITKANQSQFTGYLKYALANTLFSAFKAYTFIRQNSDGKKTHVVQEIPKDTVIIHQFPRGTYSPSLSPFALKLETWCRAANIKYQNKFSMKLSNRGLVPFITLNEYTVEDSQKCIEYLSKVYQVDLNLGLTDEQKAIARAALALSEDSLRWVAVLHRFWYSTINRQETNLPLLSLWLFGYKTFRAGWASGYARYTKQELYDRGKQDLTALNHLIGNKKFLLSDTKPCDVDFAIFGVCAQIKFNDRGPLNQHLLSECHNVNRHIETIKSLYWSDWDQNTLAGRKKALAVQKKTFFQKILSLIKK